MNARGDENLDQAYERFRQNHEALRDALMAALPASTNREKRFGAADRLRQFTGGVIMEKRITKLAVAAAIIVIVSLALHYLGGSPVETGIAWAEVLQNMEAAQTVTFALESEDVGDENEQWWGKGETKIKGPFRHYDGTSGGRYGDGPIREETVSETCDLSQQNRFVLLKPRTRWAFTADSHGYVEKLLTYDGLKQNFRDGTEENLGKVEMDGRTVVCFRVSKDDRIITVWADPNTALPVRIEQTANHGKSKLVLSSIAFDVPLDDNLFNMTPPPDYVVVNMTTEVFTIPFELTEEYLVRALAIEAKTYGGRFPILWMGGRPGQEALDASIAESKTVLFVEEADDTMLGTEYIKRLPEGSEWQYFGEGVLLGEANKPVFWYRLPGAPTCRTVYGDLSVRDVAPQDLPQVPWPPKRK